MKIAHIEWEKKAQNIGKSPKNQGFRGCWTVPPFQEHPVDIPDLILSIYLRTSTH